MPDAAPIVYPLDMPTGNIANIEFSQESSQQVSEAPRSFARNVTDWGGERWRVQVTIQRMDYVDTAPWRAFFSRMRGSVGSFLMNPYGQGGSAQLGKWNDVLTRTLNVKTPQPGIGQDHRLTLTSSIMRLTDAFKAGDFIQLGSGSNSRLHMIMDDITLDKNDVTINVWPKPKANVLNDRVVVVNQPRGVFYFRDPLASWIQDNLWNHEISFTAYSV